MVAMSAPASPSDAPPPDAPAPTAADAPDARSDLVATSDAGPAALRGSVLLGGGYATTIALSLISAPLLIRHLGIADSGLFNIALREWSSRFGGDRTWLMRGLLGVRLQLSATGVVVGIVFAVVAGYDRAMVLGTVVAGAAMMLTATTNVVTVSLQGELRFGWITVINVVRQAVATALIVAVVLAGGGVFLLLAATFPAALAALGVAAWLVRGDMPLVPRMRSAEWWPLVRETLPYAAAVAVNTLYFRITIVVMSLVAVSQQTGYFATSFRVTEVLIGVPSLAIGAAFPILSRSARDDPDRFGYAGERIVELALIAGIALALAVALSAPFVIDVLAGPAGKPAGPVLQIQAIALAATFLTTAGGFLLLSLRRHMALLITNGGALALNLALTLVLVHTDQAQGGAIAGVLAETALAIALILVIVRAQAVRIHVARLAAVAAAGLAGAIPLLVPGVHPLIRMAAGLAIYAALLAVFRLLPPEIGHALQRRRISV
jgi:O-antigen/teichoic acid export membrane protein